MITSEEYYFTCINIHSSVLQWKGDRSHTKLHSYRAWQEWRDLQRNRKHHRRPAVCGECLKNVTMNDCCTLWTLTNLSLQQFIVVQKNSLYYVGRNKIVQCLICEQKCISIIFVFLTCTEIKTVHVLLTVITHGWGLLHLICQEENSDDFFLCNCLYHPVHVRFILKVSRVDFFYFIQSFSLKYWQESDLFFWEEKLCSWDYKNTYFLHVLSFDNM